MKTVWAWILQNPLATIGALAIILLASASGMTACNVHRKMIALEQMEAAKAEAAIFKKSAEANAAKATAAEGDAAKLRDSIAPIEQDRAKLRLEVAALKAKITPKPQPATGPMGDAERLEWEAAVNTRDAVIVAMTEEKAKDDESQAAKDKLIASLQLSSDSWKAGYNDQAARADAEFRARRAAEIALHAQEGLTTMAKIKWGIIGLATGYGAGKLQH